MMPSYDVFKMEPDGAVMWLTAAATWAEAEAVARQHAERSAIPHMIFDHVTRTRTVVKAATI